MNFPESILLCLFPNGLVLSRQSAMLSDGGDNDGFEGLYGIDFDPDCFSFVLAFFKQSADVFMFNLTPSQSSFVPPRVRMSFNASPTT
ncbi:hypothetical protein BDM02DRAFT_3184667 [Thelephora ganbajun]|uniref:Uncharacterized protein n=1 Tax=Thelephora ganbajun TaxID=370292 RepID=A0ACB6ZP25_THEGA|nr:hypothetical protein BDM02DRAFT_3184667 [Thelephora ganbajun]